MTGPTRGCVQCPARQVVGCWRCGSKLGHQHVKLTDRHGRPRGDTVVCRAHAPRPAAVTPAPAQRPSTGNVAATGRTDRQRWQDRTRRRAIRQLIDLHRDEFDRLLFEARSF